MKKISLLLSFFCVLDSYAQVTKPLAFPDLVSAAGSETHNWYKDQVGVGFSVSSPAAIAGPKVFDLSNDGSGSANEWAGAITAPILNLPVAIAAPDSLGCTPLTGGSMTGKAALIFRGNCEFGAKALAAQVAGATACIIVNNIPGGPVGMGAGAVGASVTIPTIMISQADGQAIYTQIKNSQAVTVSFTTWGTGAVNDLAILSSGVSQYHAQAIPLSQLGSGNGNPVPLKAFDGAYIANIGSANQTNVVLKSTVNFQPTSGSAQMVRKDSIQFPTFLQADSIFAVGIPGSYDIHPTSTGTYTTTYDLKMNNTDDVVGNNTATSSFAVTNNVYCKSRYDFVNNRPVSTMGYRYGSTSVTSQLAGNLFFVSTGGYAAESAQYVISTQGGVNLAGQISSIYLFKWKDNVVQDSLVEAGELELVGANVRSHTAQDTSGQWFETDFIDLQGSANKVVLDPNTWYYVAVELSNDVFLGYDGILNYLPRTFLRNKGTGADQYSEFFQVNYTGNLNDLLALQPNTLISNFAFDITRLTSQTTIDSANFAKHKDGLVASIGFKISQSPVNVKENIKTKTASIISYPNPANSTVTLEVNTRINSKELVYGVFDIVGKRIDVITHSNVTDGKDRLVLDVSKYPNGNYAVLVKSKEGVNEFVKFNVTH